MQRGVSSRAIHNWMWIFRLFLAKHKFKKIQKKIYKRDIMQLFSANTAIFWDFFWSLNTCKNCPQKMLIICRQLFSVLQTGPKSAWISYFFLCDFYIMTLLTYIILNRHSFSKINQIGLFFKIFRQSQDSSRKGIKNHRVIHSHCYFRIFQHNRINTF